MQPLAAPAGAGKTRSLKALRAAAHRSGRRVVVLAPNGRAVDVAVNECAGDVGYTIDKALLEMRNGRLNFDRSVVVVDAYQLAPVRKRGGMFEQLCTDLPWSQRLGEVWRTRDPDERTASLALRNGGPAPLRHAVQWYRKHDRLHCGDQVTMADDALTAYRADTAAGLDALPMSDSWELCDSADKNCGASAACMPERCRLVPRSSTIVYGLVVRPARDPRCRQCAQPANLRQQENDRSRPRSAARCRVCAVCEGFGPAGVPRCAPRRCVAPHYRMSRGRREACRPATWVRGTAPCPPVPGVHRVGARSRAGGREGLAWIPREVAEVMTEAKAPVLQVRMGLLHNSTMPSPFVLCAADPWRSAIGATARSPRRNPGRGTPSP
ncbi:MAG: hypothetical protein QOD93_7303 [Acetobacteraceae bacterium]|nr:hypothetical protein [Acetobacteraceae bacterium]